MRLHDQKEDAGDGLIAKPVAQGMNFRMSRSATRETCPSVQVEIRPPDEDAQPEEGETGKAATAM